MVLLTCKLCKRQYNRRYRKDHDNFICRPCRQCNAIKLRRLRERKEKMRLLKLCSA